jgi:hypothetical protein
MLAEPVESRHALEADLSDQFLRARLLSRPIRPVQGPYCRIGYESHVAQQRAVALLFQGRLSLDDVHFQTEVLCELLANLPEDARLPRLRKSLDWLLSGGLDPTSVRTIELQICDRVGLSVDDASESLPHVFVNYVQLCQLGIKLGFMTRRGSENATRAQAEKIRARLSRNGCKIPGPIVEPNPNETFFWFFVEERAEAPTVRELLESYGDVILR